MGQSPNAVPEIAPIIDFLQAEDGIRDYKVTGVQTCALPICALDRPSSGRVVFEGRDLARLGDGDLAELRLRSFGFVFQQFNLIPTLTALENVEAKLAPTGLGGRELRTRAEAVLGEVGLADRPSHLPAPPSGGGQQRGPLAPPPPGQP